MNWFLPFVVLALYKANLSSASKEISTEKNSRNDSSATASEASEIGIETAVSTEDNADRFEASRKLVFAFRAPRASLEAAQTLQLLKELRLQKLKNFHAERGNDLNSTRRLSELNKLIDLSAIRTTSCDISMITRIFLPMLRRYQNYPNLFAYIQTMKGIHSEKCLFDSRTHPGYNGMICGHLTSTLVYYNQSYTAPESNQKDRKALLDRISLLEELLEYCGIFDLSKCSTFAEDRIQELIKNEVARYPNLILFLDSIRREIYVYCLTRTEGENALQPSMVLEFLEAHLVFSTERDILDTLTTAQLINLSKLDEANCENGKYEVMFAAADKLPRFSASLTNYKKHCLNEYKDFCKPKQQDKANILTCLGCRLM